MMHSVQEPINPQWWRGRRVAVTGGTSGLGHALVQQLAVQGAHVALVARTAQKVHRVTQALPGTVGIVGDVAAKQDIYPVAAQITAQLGGVDVLINNASSLGPVPLQLLGDTACEDFEAALNTNLLGPFRLTKALLGALAASARQARGALVLNISSDAAVNAYPAWGAYGASKAALVHMTRTWHAELRDHGIHMLALDPGDMDTPMHAAALPGADRTQLQSPHSAATALLQHIVRNLEARTQGKA